MPFGHAFARVTLICKIKVKALFIKGFHDTHIKYWTWAEIYLYMVEIFKWDACFDSYEYWKGILWVLSDTSMKQ